MKSSLFYFKGYNPVRMHLYFSKFSIYLIAIVVLLNTACTSVPSKDNETVVTGRTTMLVDETFEPIIEDQLAVFESSYKDVDITLINAPENRIFYLLLSDSARVAIASRQLSEEETDFFKSKNIIPKTRKFATDAIALITHKSNPDSVISVEEIINILRGKSNGSKALVFDNPNSSTVRYLKELANIDSLPEKGVYSLKSNADVIEYVYNNPNSIGVIGLNWIAQPSPELAPLVQNLVALKVQLESDNQEAYKPTQSNLAMGLYPLARDLYLINCQGTYGLGLGFSAFLAGDRGQRLILKSGLLPDSIPTRELIIRN
jgi:phosphate transport system substrate-binding protein